MRQAEKCIESCMFKQMLVRDWDAHKVTDVAKEKNTKGGEKRVQAFYRVYLVQFVFQIKFARNKSALDSSELLHSLVFSVVNIFTITQYL